MLIFVKIDILALWTSLDFVLNSDIIILQHIEFKLKRMGHVNNNRLESAISCGGYTIYGLQRVEWYIMICNINTAFKIVIYVGCFCIDNSLRLFLLTRLMCRSKSPLLISSVRTYCIKVGTVQE